MLVTTPLAAVALVAGRNQQPVRLALSATVAAVVVNAVVSTTVAPTNGAEPVLHYTTSYKDFVTANAAMCEALKTQTEQLHLLPTKDLGVDLYSVSKPLPAAGGFFYCWADVPVGFVGVLTIAVAEQN